MSRKKPLSFAQVDGALAAFGYELRKNARHTTYRHPRGSELIILPTHTPNDPVSSLHQKMVETAIRNDQIIPVPDFQFYLENGKLPGDTIGKGDRLIWKMPGKATGIRVVAAAGEKDGLVIISQKGTFSPCPVDQLQKVS